MDELAKALAAVAKNSIANDRDILDLCHQMVKVISALSEKVTLLHERQDILLEMYRTHFEK